MPWIYAWESDNPKRWSSNFSFTSHHEAKMNALHNALNARRRANKRVRPVPTEPRIQTQLWRSLRKAGWRIRKKKVPKTEADSDTTNDPEHH